MLWGHQVKDLFHRIGTNSINNFQLSTNLFAAESHSLSGQFGGNFYMRLFFKNNLESLFLKLLIFL